MLLEIFLHVGVFTHSTDESIVDKAHVGVKLLVGGDIFFFCRFYAFSLHLREIYRKHQQRMVKFVGLIERSCKGGFRVGIRTLGVGILPERLDAMATPFWKPAREKLQSVRAHSAISWLGAMTVLSTTVQNRTSSSSEGRFFCGNRYRLQMM